MYAKVTDKSGRSVRGMLVSANPEYVVLRTSQGEQVVRGPRSIKCGTL
jgi:hypothetical protein